MLVNPMDILTQFPVRKTKRQKQMFRDAVQSYVSALGYESRVEQGSFGSRNLVIGDPEKARYLITAHYDTCARMPVPNLLTPCSLLLFVLYQLFLVVVMIGQALLIAIAAWLVLALFCTILGDPFWDALVYGSALLPVLTMLAVYLVMLLFLMGPANKSNSNDNTSGVITVLEIARSFPVNQRGKVCFVLFDLEEVGLIGSAAYRKTHKKATDRQIVLNLDCVGDGDQILIFPTKKLKKDVQKITPVYRCCGYFGEKSVLVRDKGFAIYPSDQNNFPYGAGIAAFHCSKFGPYLGRIHTPKDTIFEETNVNILRAGIISMITCGAD